MTANYSKERSHDAAQFHFSVNRSASVHIEQERRQTDETQRSPGGDLECVWETLERSGAMPRVKDSIAPLDTIEWSEIGGEGCAAKPIEFTHPSEREFARTLDARDISWEYKPRTFAVEWDDEGNFVDCFTPDFYLPASGMYIAVIASDRAVSNAKNRKVKLLRLQYPGIRIEVFNGNLEAEP